jgi:hypothetical protein
VKYNLTFKVNDAPFGHFSEKHHSEFDFEDCTKEEAEAQLLELAQQEEPEYASVLIPGEPLARNTFSFIDETNQGES